MARTSWQCPYCSHYATLGREDIRQSVSGMDIVEANGGTRKLISEFIVCPNKNCRELTLTIWLQKTNESNPDQIWKLIPDSSAKVFPSYVPRPILGDYQEACRIKNLSPKAAATLARRCLQGMIRDFWGIKGRTLADEIKALQDKVDPSTWNAIDAVRSIGNIGAHMEKDVNIIVDVDPDEAGELIELLEFLLKDWYITREERKQQMERIIGIAEQKKADKTQSATPVLPNAE
jgi:hypothetical protein